MKTWTAKLDGRDLSITNKQLHEFRHAYIGDSDLSKRMSDLIWFDIYVMDAAFGVSPQEVLRSVRNVEEGEPHSGIKPATMFTRPPLKGLWHKHFFSAHFLLQNISLALGKSGIEKLVDKVMDEKKSPVFTPEMRDELAHRLTHEPVEERDRQGKLTGEWVVFAKIDGENLYLCANTHNAGDQFILDRIKQHCVPQFPQLATVIT